MTKKNVVSTHKISLNETFFQAPKTHVLSYDLNDTKVDLVVGKMGFLYCDLLFSEITLSRGNKI